MVKKNKIDRAWIHRHVNDGFVQQSRQDGYRSRAAYKLLAIVKRLNLLKNCNTVVDLGCAPGSWLQVLVRHLGHSSTILGVDLLKIDAIEGVEFIQGDFTDDRILASLVQKLGGREIDVILSDMAPNITGIRMVDQARSSNLILQVLDFSRMYLKFGGVCVIKAFVGSEFDKLLALAKKMFATVEVFKPDASRGESSETYILAVNLKSKTAMF